MLFPARRVRRDILFHKPIGIADDLYNIVFIRPYQEIFPKPWVFLAGPSHNGQFIIFLLAPGHRPGRTFGHTDAASDTFFLVSYDLIVLHPQRIDRQTLTALNARLTVHTAAGIVLRQRHADDAKVVHPDLCTVVRAPCTGDLKVQIVGKYFFFDPFCQFCGVVVGKRTDIISDTGDDISRARRGITRVGVGLVNLKLLDNRLKFLIDRIHIFQMNPLDLKPLPGRQMYIAISVCLGDLLHHP